MELAVGVRKSRESWEEPQVGGGAALLFVGTASVPRWHPMLPATADQLGLLSISHASRRSRTLSNARAKKAEEAGLPEVGVEMPPQLIELQCPAAGLRLKVPPDHTPTGLRHACVVPPAQMVSAALVLRRYLALLRESPLDRFTVRAQALHERSRASLWRSGDDHSQQARRAAPR